MNMLKTTFLMALLTGVLVAVGGVFAGHTGMIVMLIISIGMNFMTYWYSDKWALAAYDAQEVTASEAPELYHLVETLASRDSLPMPRVYIIDSDVPNAFATGRNPAHAAVAVTTGIMRVLDYNEIAGVLGHELSHVKHRDILISTIAAAFAGVISIVSDVTRWSAIFGMNNDEDNNSVIGFIFTIIVAPIAAMLIQLAISRSREYSADEAGGRLFILAHAGIRPKGPQPPERLTAEGLRTFMSEQDPEDLLWIRQEFWGQPTGLVDSKGKGPIVVAGHTPTAYLEGMADRMERSPYTEEGLCRQVRVGACEATGGVSDRWDIDSGAAGGAGFGQVSMVRLDDGEEFYEQIAKGE